MSAERSPRYLPIDRCQHVLLPLDVDRLIDFDHVARRIWRVVDSLDREVALIGTAAEARAVFARNCLRFMMDSFLIGTADNLANGAPVCNPPMSERLTANRFLGQP